MVFFKIKNSTLLGTILEYVYVLGIQDFLIVLENVLKCVPTCVRVYSTRRSS